MLNLPNCLTLVRILTIPIFLEFLAYHFYGEALAVFILGGFTDFLDGLIARKMKQQTALGAYLDPVADKLLVITSFVMLGAIGGIPMWLAVVVIVRDILIIIGYAIIYVLVEEPLQVKPSRLGKWSTTLQLVTLGVALALLYDPTVFSASFLDLLVWATAVTTVVSGCQYLYRGLLWLQNRAASINRPG
ncbi:MAG TPA: CDP-diacylglycerol--glycerol-3-phosphate 3-phosphatidyltransferase [Candidatus Binatia bacterium]|jgi:cardiolipin synthase|nr:CDP-diacylglycerol--glycerol-3-phosphate 3-phosphatidyltransferase [Candidatus Binatia bacterium]